MAIRTLEDLRVEGTSLGVRVDINSPLDGPGLADDSRLRAHESTLSELLDRGGRVAVLAHQGRPGGEEFESLQPHAARLEDLLESPVEYTDATCSSQARSAINGLTDGEAVVLENTRFYSEEYLEFEPERAAETHLVSRLAPHFDAYVNDAFAAAHRSQPSLVGFPTLLPAYAGRVMEREIEVLGSIDETPTPRAYVIGGAKVPDSIDVIRHGLERGLADSVLLTGLVANVFMVAAGVELGSESNSVIRERGHWSEIERARDLLDSFRDHLHLPVDVAVPRDGERVEIPVSQLPAADTGPVKDIGGDTVREYRSRLEDVGTVILNGPAGVFEEDGFAVGTEELFAVAASAGYSVVGGGDTGAAVRRLGIEGFDHVSTGGGAALRMLTDGELPAIEVLKQ